MAKNISKNLKTNNKSKVTRKELDHGTSSEEPEQEVVRQINFLTLS